MKACMMYGAAFVLKAFCTTYFSFFLISNYHILYRILFFKKLSDPSPFLFSCFGFVWTTTEKGDWNTNGLECMFRFRWSNLVNQQTQIAGQGWFNSGVDWQLSWLESTPCSKRNFSVSEMRRNEVKASWYCFKRSTIQSQSAHNSLIWV